MQDNHEAPHTEITETILGCSFDVMNELGIGFLESVYKNALVVALREKGVKVEIEKRFQVTFRGQNIGLYIADLVVEETVIVELKCCEKILPEHQAQTINYLKSSGVLVGLLINFGKRKVAYKSLHHPDHPATCDPVHPVFKNQEASIY